MGRDVSAELTRSTLLTTSAIGGDNWVGDTYTSDWESVDIGFFATILQTDEDGIQFIDFSLDGGVTFSSYPVNGVNVFSGINEVHTGYKGTRSIRIRFIGTGGRTYFRLLTDYSPYAIQLTAPINQALTSDQDAVTVRAFQAGLNPDGIPQNLDAPGFYSSQSSYIPREIGTRWEPSGWAEVNGYGSHQFALFSNATLDDTYYTDVQGNQGMFLLEVSNDGINKATDFIIEVGTNPPAESAIFTFAFPYFRAKVAPPTNTETFFSFNVTSYAGQPVPPIRAIDAQFTGRGLGLTTRTVLFGRTQGAGSDDVFDAAVLSENGNLIVAQGDRISQTGGRIHFELGVIDAATGSLYTVPDGFNLYLTSIEWAGTNASITAPVRARLRDGGASGDLKYTLSIEEAAGSISKADQGSMGYIEPTVFETSIYFNVLTGTFAGDFIFTGYLEPEPV